MIYLLVPARRLLNTYINKVKVGDLYTASYTIPVSKVLGHVMFLPATHTLIYTSHPSFIYLCKATTPFDRYSFLIPLRVGG